MNTKKRSIGLSLFCLVGSLPAWPAPLDLSNQPLQVGFAAAPNLVFLVDNSGSMDWNVVAEEGYNSVFEVYDNNGTLCHLTYTHPTIQNDAYRDFGDDVTSGSDIIYDYDNYYPVPPDEGAPSKNLWRARNKDFNLLYYDPAKTYTPWSGEDTNDNAYVDANPAAARVDPYDPSVGTFDLTSDTTYYSRNGYACQNSNMAPDTDWYPARYWRWTDTDNDDEVDGSDAHSLVEIKPGNAPFSGDGRESRTDCTDAANGNCTYTEEIQNFANWFQYYRRRMLTAQAAYTQAVFESESPAFIGLTTLNGHSPIVNTPVTDITIPDNKSFFLGQLSRLRGSGGTPLRGNAYNTGQYLACDDNDYGFSSPSHINDGSYCPALDADQGGSCQQNYMVIMTDGYYNGGFDFPGGQDNKDNGVGKWRGNEYSDDTGNTLADIAMHFFQNDIHPGGGHPNIVNHIMVPREPGKPDEVPPVPPKPAVIANHQHVTTYGVAFGVEGTLGQDPVSVAAREHATPNIPDNSATNAWPNPGNGDPEKIDDLVHAAFNGRGKFFSARDPSLLKQSLAQILAETTQPSGSAASAGSVRSSIIAGGFLYQSVGDPNDWSGGLLARPVSTGKAVNDPDQPNHANCIVAANDPDYPPGTPTGPLDVGEPCSPVWDAGAVIDGQNWNTARHIITSENDLGDTSASPAATGDGIAFRWGSLTDEQQDRLHQNSIDGSPDGNGQDRLQYLRGRTGISGFRERASVLGDILDSGAVYVGPPAFAYDFGDYATFKNDNADRDGIVYAGANDGMLHAFKAIDGSDGVTALDGSELFGYVPGDRILWANLNRLTHPSYRGRNHRYFVNGEPTYVDAQVGGTASNGNLSGADWKSLLAGGLGNGGQLVYLLDITKDSVEGTETATAGEKLEWEFSDLDDPNLGFTHSSTSIVRMNNGRWAVIVGNGYNNSDDDTNYGAASNSPGNGKASLFILYVDGPGGDGWDINSEYFRIEVPTGGGTPITPNALASPLAIDIDNDDRVDYIYAGDDRGQMWRFDVTSSASTDWNNTAAVKIFTAVNDDGDAQPISTRPEVVAHPEGVNHGVVVLFGTGRYLDKNDADDDNYPVQTFYGIWDTLAASFTPPTRADTFTNTDGDSVKVIQEQEILDEVQFAGTTNPDGSGDAEDCDSTQNCFRILTENPVNLTSGQNRGWYLDMVNTDLGNNTDSFGERMVTNPLIRGNRVVFTTLLPKDDEAVCSSGGDGWLMELDFYTGGHPSEPVFDTNGDGQINEDDRLEITLADGTTVYITPPGGIKFDEDSGLLPAPAIIIDPITNTEKKCFPRENNTMECVLEAGPSDGRLSWREIH